MQLDLGNVMAAKMNAHRHQWNGTICSQPQSWNCGADAAFRANFCDAAVPRCFHLDVFRPGAPRFFTPDPSVMLAVQQQPGLFDDQVLVFYGGRFGAQQGIASSGYEPSLFGFYRVKRASLDTTRRPHRLLIEPHPDAWAMFPRTHLRPPSLRAISGVAYLKQMRAKGLKDAIDEALEMAESLPTSDSWSPELQQRLQRTGEALPHWVEQAEEAQARLPPPSEAPRLSASFGSLEGSMETQLRGIQVVTLFSAPEVAVSAHPPLAATAALATNREHANSTAGATAQATDVSPDTAPTDSPAIGAVPEPLGRQVLEQQVGRSLVDALSVAFITKSLVILTGAPGVGKSWIASQLLDDTARERTVIVPVASTWRGREDLLGYVNPINGGFEATQFTHFLCDAQAAWETGDRRTRLVIFEEFNLSQPEHWLSDLLVRLEYGVDQLADRTIRLGGNGIADRSGRAGEVVLVPSLCFVATLNNDHTVKPLSPRVLDRAALIEVTSSGRKALTRAGVQLDEDVEDTIDALSDLLEPRGAAFSVRSARSLQRAIAAGNAQGMRPTRALDLVLVQEVFSRVRLLAGDPRDEQLLASLKDWTQRPGCADLSVCAAKIADWADLLEAGRDVFQA